MEPIFGYKLTDANMRTYGGFEWELGTERTTDGRGDLCGAGWLHYYSDPLLAVLLNPIHANYKESARLFLVEVGPAQKHDRGLKSGTTKMTIIEEIPMPKVGTAQRVKFAKLCADWAQEAAKGPRLDSATIGAKLAELAREAVS